MGLDDLSRPLAGRAIPYVVIRVKPTRHGTECRFNNLGLGLAMDAQNLIVVNKRSHGVPTTSVHLGRVQIVSRRLSGQQSEVISPSQSSVATGTDDHLAASVAPSSYSAASGGRETFRGFVKPWATLSPAGGLHLGLLALLGALIGGEAALPLPYTIPMYLRPCCPGSTVPLTGRSRHERAGLLA
jgi:hypothetical protein